MCIAGNTTSASAFQRSGADETSKILAVAAATLSVLGSVGIIITFALWKEIRTTSRHILVFISVADFLTSGGNLLGAVTPDHKIGGKDMCEVQSFITTANCLSFIVWTTLLAIYLHMSIVQGKVELTGVQQFIFAACGWAFPVTVVTFAYLLDALGDDRSAATGGWCWLRFEPGVPETMSCSNARLLWSLLTGKAWEIASYVVVPVLYLLVKRHIAKERCSMSHTLLTNRSLQAALQVNRKLTFVPMIYVLLRVWGSVRYLLEVSAASSELYAERQWLYWTLLYLQAIGDNGQGFGNFLLFCIFTKSIRRRLLCRPVEDEPANEGTPLFFERLRLGPKKDTVNTRKKLSAGEKDKENSKVNLESNNLLSTSNSSLPNSL